MAQQQTITGVRGLTSKTWYPRPPVEWGRAGGAVATISVGTATGENGTGGGTNGAVADKATTTTGPATRGTVSAAPTGGGTGLKVDLTIGGNVCTAIVPNPGAAADDGNGYRIGDKIIIDKSDSGTSTDVVGYVTSLEYED